MWPVFGPNQWKDPRGPSFGVIIGMPTHHELTSELQRIDSKGYKAYKDIQENIYEFSDFELVVDHVQGDPFASPSRLRVRVPQSTAQFPGDTYQAKSRRIALRDYLARQFAHEAKKVSEPRGSGKSGIIAIDAPGQAVLQRTAVFVTEEYVEARFIAGLPAKGRRVLGKQANVMLTEAVPEIVAHSLICTALDEAELYRHIETVEDADALRSQLSDNNLTAFVADDAVLPRRSGVDDRPMKEEAVPFKSPEALRVTLERPNGAAVTGMGIPRGVTLIVGGGYHGKSTLLEALSRGVYNHRPGDGREFVVTDPAAVKIRAEDGRSVAGVDISPFINNLPGGTETRDFSTENASGSTSQAANIVEMLEVGAETLLIDEDTSATNFMIRDHRMQELIAKEKEPITPFVDKIRQVYDDLGVSSVLVMGGSGDYFEHADTVIAMEEFLPYDATERAKEIAAQYKQEREHEGGEEFGAVTERVPLPESIDPSKGKRGVNVKVRGARHIQFGTSDIDLAHVEQLIDTSQTRAIAQALVFLEKRVLHNEATSLADALATLERTIAEDTLDVLMPGAPGDLAEFRRFELAAALNRLRTVRVR